VLNGCPAYGNDQQPASGDVDLIVGAADLMATAPALVSAPFEMKAWIESANGTEVAGSQAQPLSVLVFDDKRLDWQEGCRVSWEHPEQPPDLGRWPTYAGWVVTNSSGDGSADHCRFWRTNARGSVGQSADGADALIAMDPSEARFPDGTYVLQVRLRDLASTVSVSDEFNVIVDNFAPRLDSIELYEGRRLLQSWTWFWNNRRRRVTLPRTGTTTLRSGSFRDLTLAVAFSEPVRSAKLCLASRAAVCVSPWVDLQPTPPARASLTWSFTLQESSISQPGSYRVLLDAVDLAEKRLQPLGDRPANRTVLVFEVLPF
jgi:hypothetical protein